jgi:4-hydroxy-tetrahydrodipicolinate reductase
MLKLVVCGACGRMGKRIIACAEEEGGFELSGAIEAPGHPSLGDDAVRLAGGTGRPVPVTHDLDAAAAGCDVIVDFSFHEASPRYAQIAARRGVPIVVGATGLTPDERERIGEAARRVACIVAPNMSAGVNLLCRVAAEAARSLGMEYDVEIVEAHHRHKKDAPSGTALRLARAVAGARGQDLNACAVYGRSGEPGERPAGEIGIHAVRQGDIVGEHSVIFAGPGERIELVHRAHSRDMFAHGALRAARWIVGKPPGMYGMEDVFNRS